MRNPIFLALSIILFLSLASATGSLEASIQDSDGNPLSNVELDISGSTDTTAYTDPSGSTTVSRLNQGEHTVTASKSGYQDRSADFSVDYSGDKESVDLTLNEEIVERGQVTVTITDQNGDPLNGAQITVQGPSETQAYTDSSGETTISRLKTGSYDIEASKDGSTSDSQGFSIDYDGDTESVDLTIEIEEDVEDGPTARFSIDDNNPNVEQWVNFDASDSEGDIESYHWDFGDGDTYTDDDPKLSHRYNNEGDYTVELTVEEYDGDEDTTSKTVEVEKKDEENTAPEVNLDRPSDNQEITLPYRFRWDVSDPNSDDVESTIYIGEERDDESTLDDEYLIRENVGNDESFRLSSYDLDEGEYIWGIEATDEHGASNFSNVRGFQIASEKDRVDENGNINVFVEDSDGNPIEDAKVVADNENWFSQHTDSDGEVRFELQPGTVDVTVSKDGYRHETRQVSLDAGEEEEITVTLIERDVGSDQARLDIHVEDDDYDSLEDAKVTVENGDDEIKYTRSDGDVRFYLDADDYDITVECNGEEEHRSTYLSEGERETIDIRFDDDFESDTCGEEDNDVEEPGDDDVDTDDGSDSEGLAITDVSYPSSVCRGGSFRVDMSIENRGGFHELVTITGSGLGSINTGQNFALDIAETKSASVRFTNIEGSGTEEFDIRATNHVSDETTETINVRDCGNQLPKTDGGDFSYDSGGATGVTAEVSPKKTVVGKAVKVKGYVDGVRGRSQVTIRANGERKGTVSTEPDGYYRTYIRLDEIGDNIVRVNSGSSETSSVVEVIPTSTVSGISAPDKVFESESLEICSNVNSQIEPEVFLLKNNKIVDSKLGNGEVCFETKASETGEHDYHIKALTYGKESSSPSTSVNVLELGSEVTNFPDKVATTESEEGMVKVDLYNTHNETRNYKVTLNGIRTTWLSQSQKEVFLTQGERETVYFYLTPREEGTFEPTVTVVSEDTTIYSEEINVYAGGTKTPRKTSFFGRLSQILSL